MKHRPRTLVAAPNEDVRGAAAALLALKGHAVTTVSSAEAAVAALAETLDRIVVDVGRDGVDLHVLVSIRAAAPRARLVVMSANDQLREPVLHYGADAFAPKPFSARDLLG